MPSPNPRGTTNWRQSVDRMLPTAPGTRTGRPWTHATFGGAAERTGTRDRPPFHHPGLPTFQSSHRAIILFSLNHISVNKILLLFPRWTS